MCDKRNYMRRVEPFLFPECIEGLKARIKARTLYDAYFGRSVSFANRPRKRSSTNSGFNANKIPRENNDSRDCALAAALVTDVFFLKKFIKVTQVAIFGLRP